MRELSLPVAQTVGAAVLAFLLFGFHRQYRKSYLLHWALSWSALAVHHIGVALRWPPVAGLAGWLQIAWLLFGVWELIRRRPVRLLNEKQLLAAFALVGIIAGLAPFADITRRIALAIALGWSAVSLWRARPRRSGLGSTVLSAAFAAFAITQVTATDQTAYVDFMLQAALCIGMIASLLEEERQSAELAANEIEHLAYHDALTGLPNRPLFLDRTIVALANANRAGHKLGVLFLDLDRFKDINDSLGHTVGDALLKSVAERIRRCVREGDTVARFGGDEFTLLIPKIDYVEDAAKIAQKVIETLKIPFEILDRELFITTSVGVSIYPNDGIDSETLIRNADTAMYRAKDQGRDNYQLYAPAMNVRALERLALENMLRKALHNEELVLHYQPLIDARTRMITGVEALIRWEHPELGLLYPASFISVAELSGLILPIEQWVLRTACRQIRYWQRKIVHDMTISVNLSARQFQQPDLAEQIRVVVEDCGIQPSTLQVEITESNAMQNADNTIHILRDLKSAGIRIAMDDFGTGYSSLNYLKRFPIDTLKLDRMFVNDVATDPIDAAIVSSVIDMAHSLSLKVVAEGVETDAQVDFLTRQQCDVLQGYLFGTPRTAEEMELMLLDARAAV